MNLSAKKGIRNMRKLGMLLLVCGIAGNALFRQLQIEGPIHDVSRLAVLAGTVLLVIGLFKRGREARPSN